MNEENEGLPDIESDLPVVGDIQFILYKNENGDLCGARCEYTESGEWVEI